MTDMFPEDVPQADFPKELVAIGGYMTKAEKEQAEEEKKKRAEEKRMKTKKLQEQNIKQKTNEKSDANTHHTVDLDESHHNAAIKVQANVRFPSLPTSNLEERK